MSKKIALVNVCYDYPVVVEGLFTGINKIWQPLELAYISSRLKKAGHQAAIIDSNAMRIPPEKTWERTKNHDVVFVSSTSYDRWECPHLDVKPCVETVKSIKSRSPFKPVFLIGSHGTVRPAEMIELSGCDAVIVGEPEDAVVEVVEAEDFKSVPGVAYVENGGLKLIPRKTQVDLNALPVPDFSDLPMKKYFFDMLGNRYGVVEASRGCPFQCSYCLKKMFGPYRKKSFERVKDEIRHLVEVYKVKRINFEDLEFTANRELVEKLCDWMIADKMGLEWACMTRLDSVDQRLLTKMKKAGCKTIMYGVESASQRIIDCIGKNITIEDFRNGVAATRVAGITSVCFFMFGFPAETDEERESTVKLALELDPDYASFFLVRPYPGTKIHQEVKDTSPGLFPQSVGGDEEAARLKGYCDKAFKRFYYRPKVIFRRFLKGGFKTLTYQAKVFLYKAGVAK